MQSEARAPEKLTIGVLYGFRALMVLFVCNFHFWQQGWLGQYLTLFGSTVDFDFWTRSSYLFVDGMILLSGFLLYLPYARQTECGAPPPGPRRFYWNRVARIVPSYAAAVLLALWLIALPGGAYRDAAARHFDVITHLTFTFTFFRDTYLYTPLNGVLWTIAIEVQFYVIFPWLARAVQKRPVPVLCLLGALGVLFRVFMARFVGDLSLWVNQLPAFLDVYALGMLGAILYLKLQKRLEAAPAKGKLRRTFALATPVLFLGGCLALEQILRAQSTNGLAGHDALRLSQWVMRLPLALTLLMMMLSAAFLPCFLQKPLDNRLTRFLATISFNLYIWHQVLSVWLAKNLFPDTLHLNPPLQVAYTLLCYSASILLAMAFTYGLEQPAARLMDRLRIQYHRRKETIDHEGSPDAETVPPADPLLVRARDGGEGSH